MSRFSKLEFGDEQQSHPTHRPEVIKDEGYYLDLARERLQEGNYESALRFYSRALEFETKLPDAWLGQVWALLELDEPTEAQVWADKGLEQFEGHPEMLAAKGVALARLGDPRGALGLSDAAMAGEGSTPYRWRARGDVLLHNQDRNADFCFDKALAAAAGDWYEPLAIGRVQLYHKRHAPALRFLELAADRNGSSAFLWENLGVCYEGLGRREKALLAYRNALDLERYRDVARAALARLEHQGLVSRLLSAMRRWIGLAT